MSGRLQDESLLSLLRCLLDAHADANKRCLRTKKTPLHDLAVKCNRPVAGDCVAALLEAKADPLLKTKLKNTAVQTAAQKKNLFVAEPLLVAVGHPDWFQWAAAEGFLALMNKLLFLRCLSALR